MIETNRLVLRQWRDQDFPAFANLCDDEAVMEFFPKRLTRAESVAMGQRLQSLIAQRGWGCWAVEVPGENPFIGFVGLHIPKPNLPFSPCVEIGWRLAKAYWGRGYATEAAIASLGYAFTQLDLDQVVSFATLANSRSQAVMKKLGMHRAGTFSHPDLEPTDPLCKHVLYKISKSHWQASVNTTAAACVTLKS